MKRLLIALALLATSVTASSAAGSYLALQLTSGTGDFATEAGGFAAAYDHSEWGFKAEFWNMMSEDYAVTLSGGIGLFSEEDKPGTNAFPGTEAFKYTQSAWSFRVGGDRVVGIGERSYIFFGPGIDVWSGKAKFEGGPFTTPYETESTMRIGLSGRLGGHMMIGESWGLTLQGGHKLGYASYEENGAKSTWWPSSMDASGGLVFRFGD